jgi:hypothetical protein
LAIFLLGDEVQKLVPNQRDLQFAALPRFSQGLRERSVDASLRVGSWKLWLRS